MPVTLSREQIKAANAAFLQDLEEARFNPEGLAKRASVALTDFTRLKIREEGIVRNIVTPVQVQNDDLTRLPDTDKPVVVVEKEVDVPAAVNAPFLVTPPSLYIKGDRYFVPFARIETHRITKDVDELRTYIMDIRQIIADNQAKEVMAREDGNWFNTINTILIGPDVVHPFSGVAQWRTIHGGIDRQNVIDAFKILPSTPGNWETSTVVCNQLTIREFQKWERNEMGGDFSEDLIRRGWAEREFLNARWFITIKKHIVPNNTLYFFADERALGRFFLLEDLVMYVHRRHYLIEFFGYETIGMAVGNIFAAARADFV